MHGDAGISSQPTKAWSATLYRCMPAPSARMNARRSTRAPSGAVKGRRIRPRRGHGHGCPCLFVRAGCPVEKPLRPFTNLAGIHACQAHPFGCPFSWLLLFGHAKRSDSVAPRPKAPQAIPHTLRNQTPRNVGVRLRLTTNLRNVQTNIPARFAPHPSPLPKRGEGATSWHQHCSHPRIPGTDPPEVSVFRHLRTRASLI
jgi:hypothetical protein